MSNQKTSNLKTLYEQYGQSPWLDNIRRGWITGGDLQQWVDMGVRGLTSNPSIFQKAIAETDDYDEEFQAATSAGASIEDAYWKLVSTDIAGAAQILRPVYDASDGADGYVSVEVAPDLAYDSYKTAAAARNLNTSLGIDNLYVKIPGTTEGLPAITQMIAERRNINVTLIFSVQRYAEVADAYLDGLEQVDGDLSRVSSVASFFVSRIDTEVDRRLEEIGTPDALALRGKTAIACCKAAYAHYQQLYSSPRWKALEARGARPQRLLWASTSTKNPDYRDTLYVDELIGPDTVNTLPDATLEAFQDHGTLSTTITSGIDEAQACLTQLGDMGIDLDEVSEKLTHEGVAAFTKSFDELLDTLANASL